MASVCLLLHMIPAAWAEQPCPSAQSAIVITSDGRTLYEKNADDRALIASTTKLMTAIVTIENCWDCCWYRETMRPRPWPCMWRGAGKTLRSL